METNTPRKSAIVKSYTIPMDVFTDILRILLSNETNYSIVGINEREDSILIQVTSDAGNSRHKKVRENITAILTEYGYFLQGTPGEYPEEEEA